MRPVNIPYNGQRYYESVDVSKRATPGLALNSRQLVEMALTGRVSVQTKQGVYESSYNIDEPNPMRAPNVDISDAHKYSNQLADDMEKAVKKYNNLKEQLKNANTAKQVTQQVPTPITQSPQV